MALSKAGLIVNQYRWKGELADKFESLLCRILRVRALM
jgi:hypothetical protein